MGEQAAGSSGAPLDYEGRIALDPILLDADRLMAVLETGVFELRNTRVHQNLLLHHIGRSMARSAVFLWELCAMAGRVYRPTDLLEINWSDLDGVEFRHRASPGPQEELPVREEIVEGDDGCQEHGIFRTFSFLFYDFSLVLFPPRSFLSVSLFPEMTKHVLLIP